MRTTSRLACIILCLAACSGVEPTEPRTHAAARPLINGELDTGDEAVVALLLSNGFPFCTGTLISPSVIATAAHCVDDAGSDPAISAFFGSDAYGDGRKVDIIGARRHLGWTGAIGEYDIALLKLAFSQDPGLPIPLNTTPLAVDDPLRRVGFGIYNTDGESDGKKRHGNTAIVRLCQVAGCNQGISQDAFETGGPGANTCSGDSGGPAFITGQDGLEYLAGVHSYGSQNAAGQCLSGRDGDTAVHVYIDDFIQPWIQENDPTCGKDNVCARIGCVDDPDCVPCGPDGTCVSDCPLPDPDCTTQDLGEICQLDTQCISGKCIFYPGDLQYRFCSRQCEPANDDCPDGMTCQNIAGEDVCSFTTDPPGVLGDSCSAPTDCGSYICEQNTCVYECNIAAGRLCPPDFACTSIDDGANYFCHSTKPKGGGGCSTGSDGAGNWLIVFGVIVALARRRRSHTRRLRFG